MAKIIIKSEKLTSSASILYFVQIRLTSESGKKYDFNTADKFFRILILNHHFRIALSILPGIMFVKGTRLNDVECKFPFAKIENIFHKTECLLKYNEKNQN
jgi:hypothetical protein